MKTKEHALRCKDRNPHCGGTGPKLMYVQTSSLIQDSMLFLSGDPELVCSYRQNKHSFFSVVFFVCTSHKDEITTAISFSISHFLTAMREEKRQFGCQKNSVKIQQKYKHLQNN